MAKRKNNSNGANGATLGYEAPCCQMGDALRGSMDAAEPLAEKMKRLTATLSEQQAEAAKPDTAIARNLTDLGYGL